MSDGFTPGGRHLPKMKSRIDPRTLDETELVPPLAYLLLGALGDCEESGRRIGLRGELS